MDLALNNPQRSICHKTNKPNQTRNNYRSKHLKIYDLYPLLRKLYPIPVFAFNLPTPPRPLVIALVRRTGHKRKSPLKPKLDLCPLLDSDHLYAVSSIDEKLNRQQKKKLLKLLFKLEKVGEKEHAKSRQL